MRMVIPATATYQCITLLLLFLCIVSPIESYYREQQQSNNGKNSTVVGDRSSSSSIRAKQYQQVVSLMTTPTVVVKNLCSKDRDMKLVCHCTPEDFIHIKATKADCWIFHDDFSQSDPNWAAFETQIYLENLKITVQRTGYLGYIPSNIMPTLNYLKTVDISYGQINEINSYAFRNRTTLEQIILANNQIRSVMPYAFAHHMSLVHINLEQNHIVNISKSAFVDLANLTTLNLAKNNITHLHDDVFIDLRKLIDLELESNSITVLTREMFKGLGNLRTLRLSYNNIEFIGDTVFAELWSLQELYLENNNLKKILERAFDGLNVLQRLRLTDNALTMLEPGVFTGVPALRYLDLSNNKIKTITFMNIHSLWDNLVNISSTLILTGNRLLCDCRLKWIFELRRKTKNDDLRKSLEGIECFYDIGVNSVQESYDNSLKAHPNGPNENGDYVEETQYVGEFNRKNAIQLQQFDEEQLPCPQRLLSEPTEQPMSRESIGMDLSWRSDIESNVSHNVSCSISRTVSLYFLCLNVFFVYFCHQRIH